MIVALPPALLLVAGCMAAFGLFRLIDRMAHCTEPTDPYHSLFWHKHWLGPWWWWAAHKPGDWKDRQYA